MRLWSPDRVDRFAEFVLESVWFSVLRVHDARMARQIFVSTNLHGKKLNLVSLLKGQIGDLARTEAELESVRGVWEEVREFSGQSHVETLRAFDGIERAEIQADTWPTDLGAFLSEIPPEGGVERWMGRFRAYAYGWKDCKRVLWGAGDSRIEQDLWRLHIFRWQEWHPLALRWWNQVHFAKQNGQFKGSVRKDLERRFDWLHRRCMAITLARFSEADRQKIFANAMRQDKDGRDPLVSRGALTLSASHRAKIDRTLRTQIDSEEVWAPLIRWIEILEWRSGLPDLVRQTNTEHLLPRNPEARLAAGARRRPRSLQQRVLLARQPGRRQHGRQRQDAQPRLRAETARAAAGGPAFPHARLRRVPRDLAGGADRRARRDAARPGVGGIEAVAAASGVMAGARRQVCMPQRRTVAFSMLRKIRFSTVRPIRITVNRPANTAGMSSMFLFS